MGNSNKPENVAGKYNYTIILGKHCQQQQCIRKQLNVKTIITTGYFRSCRKSRDVCAG